MQDKVQAWMEKFSQKLNIPIWAIGIIFFLLLLAAVVISISRIDQTTVMPGEGDAFQTTVSGLDIVLKLAVVVILIYASLFLIGRMRGGSLSSGRQHIEVIASSRLSPKQAIHIVRVGERSIIVGATDHHVSFLGDFEDESVDGDAFSDVLSESMIRQDGNPDARLKE